MASPILRLTFAHRVETGFLSLWFRRESRAKDRDWKAVSIQMVNKVIEVFETIQGKNM